MYLITAATSFEMNRFWDCLDEKEKKQLCALVTGIGPVETAVKASYFLASSSAAIKGVFNIGIGGAFIRAPQMVGMLDVCIAQKEILGDLGVCFDEEIEPLDSSGLDINTVFDLDSGLLKDTCSVMDQKGLEYKAGNFVTVNCVSATEKRGEMLTELHNGICENMEGAALARVCQEAGLPLVEMRCISNMVEDRNKAAWKIKEAAIKCGEVAATVIKGLLHD